MERFSYAWSDATNGTYLQIYGVFVDLALVFIIAFGVVEHGVNVAQKVIDRLILLSFVLSLSGCQDGRYVDWGKA